jgi:hypothetical protein
MRPQWLRPQTGNKPADQRSEFGVEVHKKRSFTKFDAPTFWPGELVQKRCQFKRSMQHYLIMLIHKCLP